MSAALPYNAARESFYKRIARLGLTPLWETLHNLVPREPASVCRAAHWRWQDVQPALAEAGTLITAEEAVRRVLILENPGMPGGSCITQSLYAGLQLILPGETAPPHRHTQSALRFVVSGEGATTTVEGERITMQPGDFIITPNWAWHEHAGGSEPVVWLDGLDIPLVRFFDAGFAENAADSRPAASTADTSLSHALWGSLMRPVDAPPPYAPTSPVVYYPYVRAHAALCTMAVHTEPDMYDGYKLAYSHPLTGGSPIPTIQPYLQSLPAGFRGVAQRSTAGTVLSVVSGHARVTVDREVFDLQAKDHLVVPSWHWHHFESDSGCVIFSFSDSPVQQALGLLRIETGKKP